MSIQLRNPFVQESDEHKGPLRAPPSPTIVAVNECRNPDRIGPWRLRRAHSEPDNRYLQRKPSYSVLYETRPPLKQFLAQVDEDCARIERLATLDGHHTTEARITPPHDGDQRLRQSSSSKLEVGDVRKEATICATSLVFPILVCAMVVLVVPPLLSWLIASGNITVTIIRPDAVASTLLGAGLGLLAISTGILTVAAIVCSLKSARGKEVTLTTLAAILLLGFLLGVTLVGWLFLGLLRAVDRARYPDS